MVMALTIHLKVPANMLDYPLQMTALDRRLIAPGAVTHLTVPLHVSVFHHKENMPFYLIESPERAMEPYIMEHLKAG